MKSNLLRLSNKYMVSGIIIKNRYSTYLVRAEEWISPRMYCIDAQDPHTGDTAPILKKYYKAVGFVDENGEIEYFWKGGGNTW